MNAHHICSHLTESGYDAELANDGSALTVRFQVGERRLVLVHEFPNELLRVPVFYLAAGYVDRLGHVGVGRHGEGREVCIADVGSTAVNADRPELVYLETVREHVRLLTCLIENPAYNRAEQLREFEAHWESLCRIESGGLNELFVVWDGREAEALQLKPPLVGTGTDLRKTPIALAGAMANDHRLATLREIARWESRPVVGKGLGVAVSALEPAPGSQDELLSWYFRVIQGADAAGRRELRRLTKKRNRDYWLVFSAPIPGGQTMFAVRWRSRSSAPLPGSDADAETGRWTVTPYKVRSLSAGSVVPRGGGCMDLGKKSVLLVGCGSVGGELAMRLTSAGVGRLTISDHETFSEDNLYRHVLSMASIGTPKTVALAREIALRHPWAEVTSWRTRLEELRDSTVLRRFDLVVVAIGSPTVERAFAEHSRRASLGVPVINCWLEGHGIGGHAILAIPATKGCWHCAYMDPRTLTRGLTSNLNFLEAGQVVMRNQGGCGTQFLPYNQIAASCTSTMTADLAVRFLEGEVVTSSKVSWKGRDTAAIRASLKVTWRYRRFRESLQILPLHNPNCDVCGS